MWSVEGIKIWVGKSFFVCLCSLELAQSMLVSSAGGPVKIRACPLAVLPPAVWPCQTWQNLSLPDSCKFLDTCILSWHLLPNTRHSMFGSTIWLFLLPCNGFYATLCPSIHKTCKCLYVVSKGWTPIEQNWGKITREERLGWWERWENIDSFTQNIV